MSATTDRDIDHLIDVVQGKAEPPTDDKEHRGNRRHEWAGPIAFVQTTQTGGKSIPTVLQCRDISSTGIGVTSRYMLHVGFEGAVLMERASGERVILGVTVAFCNYVGDAGHHCGLRFVATPEEFSLDDFLDEQGNMPVLRQARAA